MEAGILIGKVTRALRNANGPQRDVYSGLIQTEPSQQGEPWQLLSLSEVAVAVNGG